MKRGADHLHFTAEGYRQFGKRYAEKMLSLLRYEVDQTISPNYTTCRLSAAQRLMFNQSNFVN